MAGPRYDLETDTKQLKRDVKALASDSYPYEAKMRALRAALVVNRLRQNPFTMTEFLQVAGNLAAKLQITMPQVTDQDLDTYTHDQLVALAQNLELYQWDWSVRIRALDITREYFEEVGSITNDADFLNFFRAIANNIRADRGLTAIS